MRFLLIFLLVLPVTAQVTVDQGFIDSANKSFIEVKASREVIKAQESEIQARKETEAALNAVIAAQKAQIDSLLILNSTLKQQNADLAKLKCSKVSFLFVLTVKRCS